MRSLTAFHCAASTRSRWEGVVPLARVCLRMSLVMVLLSLAAAGALAQQRVGINAAVNTDATGTPPSGAAKKLVIGEYIVFNERIQTMTSGQAQVLFVDESTMTVGPDSDITIDKFVFDPATNTGTMALSATRGVLRLIGGKLTKQEQPVTMRSTIATIALRGGVMVADLHRGEQLDVAFLFGKELSVTGTNGVTQSITHPGFGITVPGPGAAPSAPYRIPPGELARLLARLDGRPRGNGGATNIPTDTAVANSGVGNTISGDLPQSIQQATAQTQALGPKPIVPNPATQSQQAGGNTAPQVINCVSSPSATGCNPQSATTVGTTQSGQPVGGSGTVVGTSPGTPPPSSPTGPPSGPVAITYAGLVKNTTNPGFGFLNQDANHRTPYSNATLQQGTLNLTLANGITVTSLLPPGTNTVQGNSSQGPFTATTFLSPDQTFFYANAMGSGTNSNGNTSGVAFIFGGMPVNSSFFAPPTATTVTSFALQPDIALNNAPIPMLPPSQGGALSSAAVSPLFIAAPAGTPFGSINSANNPNVPAPHWMQASIAANGAGASQSSALVVNTGDFFTSSDTGAVAGGGQVRGVYNAAGAAPALVASTSATVPDGNNNNLFGGSAITGFVLDQNQYNSTQNFQQSLAVVNAANGAVTNYAFNQPAVTSALPAGVGASRTTQGLTGFAAGVMYPTIGGVAGAPYAVIGASAVVTDAVNNTAFAAISGADPFTSTTSGVSQLLFTFGNPAPNTQQRSAFIDDNNFAATESTQVPAQFNGSNVPAATTPTGPGARAALVTANTAPRPAGILPATAPACQCQYLQWGYWTGELDQVNGSGQVTRSDRAPINFFVAGQPSVNVPTTGIGTYNGAAIGSVNNNGANYIAAGNFTNTFNFGNNTGTASINNFDGKSLSASVIASGSTYTGSLAGTGLSGQLIGSFYGPNTKSGTGGAVPAETGGSFAFRAATGLPYLAGGIFYGK